MMHVVRYLLSTFDPVLKLPSSAQVLSVGWKHGQSDLSLWALSRVDDTTLEERVFRVVATGDQFELREHEHFVGTATIATTYRTLIWHVFETRPRPDSLTTTIR